VLIVLLVLLGLGTGGFYLLFLPHQARTLAAAQTEYDELNQVPQNLDQLQALVTTLEALQTRLDSIPAIAAPVYAQAQSQGQALQQTLDRAQAQLVQETEASQQLQTAKRLAAEAVSTEEMNPILDAQALAVVQEKWIGANYFLSQVPQNSWAAIEADRLRAAYGQQLLRLTQLQTRFQAPPSSESPQSSESLPTDLTPESESPESEFPEPADDLGTVDPPAEQSPEQSLEQPIELP